MWITTVHFDSSEKMKKNELTRKNVSVIETAHRSQCASGSEASLRMGLQIVEPHEPSTRSCSKSGSASKGAACTMDATP